MTAQHAHAGGARAEHAPDHAHPNYVKIWGILVILLAVSIVGPMAGHLWITLVTAFGIAVVKALMVAAYFMHLNIEKAFIKYLLYTVLILMLVFFAGVAPDVMKPSGQNWKQTTPAAATAPAPKGH